MGKVIKFIVGFLGVLITVSGHYLRNGERYPWIVETFAPNHGIALRVYEEMLESTGFEKGRTPKSLKPGDIGFDQLLEILAIEFPELSNNAASVAQFRIKSIGYMAGYSGEKKRSYAGIQPEFEVSLKSGKILSKHLFDLRPEIRKRFLEDGLYIWGTLLVWTGAAITVTSLIWAAIFG